MKRRVLLLAVVLVFSAAASAGDPPERTWSRIWGTGLEDYGYGVAADPSGGVYLVGTVEAAFDDETLPGIESAFLTRHEDDGTRSWTRIFGPTDSYAEANAVVVDGQGAVYVAGQTWADMDGETAVGNGDLLLTKFQSDGTADWTRIWGSAGSDVAFGVAVDGSDYVYVVGYARGTFDEQPAVGDRDLCLSKFDSDGTREWSRIWGSTSADYAHDVVVDSSGSIYVTGYTEGEFDGETLSGSRAAFLTKFTSAGAREWSRLWGGSGVNYGNGVTVDGDDEVYVAGFGGSMNGQTSTGSTDAFLVKVGSDGTVAWTEMWGSSAGDFGYDVAFDGADGLLVTGQAAHVTFDGVPGPSGAYLTRIDTDGVKDWTIRWGTSSTEGRGVAVAGEGTFVGGFTYGAFDGQVYLEFEDLWLSRLDQPAPPPEPPQITEGPTVTDITAESAVVRWKTDKECDGTVEYRPDPGVGTETASDPALTMDHAITLTGLLPGTTYRYEVRSEDEGGLSVSSAPAFFITGAPVQEDNIAFDEVRGTFKDVAKEGRDAMKMKCVYTVAGEVPDLGFDPSTMEALIWFEVSAAPALDIPIPVDDPGWKVTKKGLRWKSPKGVVPKVLVKVSTAKRKITLKLSRFDTPIPAAAHILVGFRFGDDRGVYETDWVERKPGKFKYP